MPPSKSTVASSKSTVATPPERKSLRARKQICYSEEKKRKTRSDELSPSVDIETNFDRVKRRREVEDSGGPEVVKKYSRKKDGREIDCYCWLCHKVGDDRVCTTCSRVFHNSCLNDAKQSFSPQGVCDECSLESVDGTEPDPRLTCSVLQKVLTCLMIKIYPPSSDIFLDSDYTKKPTHKKKNAGRLNEIFIKWPQYQYKMPRPMDIEILIDCIKSDVGYTKTAEFLSDVKWIYHNCCKVFGADSSIANEAKHFVKSVTDELLMIDACHECYYKTYNAEVAYDCDPFTKVCDKPHTLVWAKLKGFSHWPSKCLKVIGKKAYVIFFGTHDISKVNCDTCFLMSQDHPSGKSIERKSYKSSIKELHVYINNYERLYGPFEYAAMKTPFKPSESYNSKQISHSERRSTQSSVEEVTLLDHNEREVSGTVTESSGVAVIPLEPESTIEDSFVIDLEDEAYSPQIMISSVAANGSQVRFETDAVEDHSGNPKILFSTMNPDNNASSFAPAALSVNMVFSEDGSSIANDRSESAELYSQRINNFDSSVNTNVNQDNLSQTVASSVPNSRSTPMFPSNSDTHNRSLPSSRVLGSSHELIDQSHLSLSPLQLPVTSHVLEYSPDEQTPSSSHVTNNKSTGTGFVNNGNDDDICVVNQVVRNTNRLSIDNLENVSDASVRDLVTNGSRYISQFGNAFLKYSGQLLNGPSFIHTLLQKIVELDLKLQVVTQEKEALKNKRSAPYFARVVRGVQKIVDQKNAEEKQKLVIQEVQTDLLSRDILMTTEDRLSYEIMKNDEVLNAKMYDWCKHCQEPASYHCCLNTNYCSKLCMERNFPEHQSSCGRRKAENSVVPVVLPGPSISGEIKIVNHVWNNITNQTVTNIVNHGSPSSSSSYTE